MQPDPADFDVTADELRKRMKLTDDVKIFATGVECIYGDDLKSELKEHYDSATLLLRTFPDFTLFRDIETYYVEAKCRTTSIEAIGLYYNKMRERMGARVLYSFPDVTIPASLIPMEEIQIPLKYAEKFNTYLKDLFVQEGCIFNYWTSNPKNGSGDPFVRIDEEDLKLLAEGQ